MIIILFIFCCWILSMWLEPDFQRQIRSKETSKRSHHNHEMKGYRRLSRLILEACQNVRSLEIKSTNTNRMHIMCWALFSQQFCICISLIPTTVLWHLSPFLSSATEDNGVVKWLAQGRRAGTIYFSGIPAEYSLHCHTMLPLSGSLTGLFRGQVSFSSMLRVSIVIFNF